MASVSHMNRLVPKLFRHLGLEEVFSFGLYSCHQADCQHQMCWCCFAEHCPTTYNYQPFSHMCGHYVCSTKYTNTQPRKDYQAWPDYCNDRGDLTLGCWNHFTQFRTPDHLIDILWCVHEWGNNEKGYMNFNKIKILEQKKLYFKWV